MDTESESMEMRGVSFKRKNIRETAFRITHWRVQTVNFRLPASEIKKNTTKHAEVHNQPRMECKNADRESCKV